MKSKSTILLVEDEPAIATGLVDVFVFHGFDITAATTGDEGLALALTGKFDLILLDVMLPGLNGFDICAAIRAQDKEQPIIMLTAKASDEDIINGLELGADDYVAKPFSVAPLVLRVKAVLRRSRRLISEQEKIVLHDAIIDPAALTGTCGDAAVDFTQREIELLLYLQGQTDRVVTRAELLAEVWGYSGAADLETRTIDIHIAKLRKKIERKPSAPRSLITVRGVGYRLLLPDVA